MSKLKELNIPIFKAEGLPRGAAAESWTVRVGGMLARPAELNFDDFRALPNSIVDCRLTSVSGWSVRAVWEGVLWRDFLKSHPPSPQATHATFVSVGGYDTTVPLDTLDHPRVLFCWGVAGEALEVEYGGPLRMVIPNLWGYKSCKWLTEVRYGDKMPPGFWEKRGYSLEGEIEPGHTTDYNNGRTRRPISGGEVTEF